MKSSVTPQKPYIHTRNQLAKLIPCLHFQIFTVWSVKAATSITKLNPTELLSRRNFIVTDIHPLLVLCGVSLLISEGDGGCNGRYISAIKR
ncbi:hypothetical protein Lepto7375DRAFT_2764 [Leptolyngbya sp. PCC 7375]|nr:hypothetical protein Lepto7375DRAFT_2764 [Leptolyngbya sp. PCC 7375]